MSGAEDDAVGSGNDDAVGSGNDDAVDSENDDAVGSGKDDVVGGTYTLIVDLPEPTTVTVGALGEHRFPDGTYAYVGSALGTGGFSRVDRHRRIARGDHDVRHWHVDYLLGHPNSRLRDVVRSRGVDVECAVAERLPDGPVEGFGASDCGCRTHLAVLEDGTPARERLERVHRAVESDGRR